MKYPIILLPLLFVTVVSSGDPHTMEGYVSHDPAYDMFYEDLLPYGEWLEVDAGVVVWRPRYAYRDWRPYSIGRWVWTRHGWYWLSSEPFGWAVFHYGRWSMHPRFGWVWHPGSVWGPAWVEWRYSSAYIGWAPLPPAAVFHVTFGVRFTRHWIAPVDAWCFIPYRAFGRVRYRDHLVPQSRVQRIIGSTRRGRTATIDRNVIVNRGIDREVIERRGSVRVDRYDIREAPAERSDRIRGNRIDVYRPDRSRGDGASFRREDTSRRDPIIRSPERRKPSTRKNDALERPQPQRKESRARSPRQTVPDRRVAPNVRKRPERSQPSSPPRSGKGRTGRSRDN